MSATPTSFEADRPGPGARGAGARGVLGRLYRRDLAGYPATGIRDQLTGRDYGRGFWQQQWFGLKRMIRD